MLSKHFKPKELRELFALLNADILHLPIGTPKGIVVDDEAAAVAAIRQLLGAIEKGVFAGPGVRIALGGLSSFDDKALRDRTFIEREREAVEKQARQLKADLEAAKGLEKLAARKQQLDKALAEKRAFRDRFERHLADRAKLSAMLTHEADQLEAQRELEAEMLGLTEQERGLDREITELRARLAGRERERQNVLRLQDDIRPPPADEPAGLPFPGPFPSELERLLEEYLYDLRDKRQIDEDIGRELEFIELAGAGAHLCETEDASIESLVESLASIPQREELYEKAKRTAIARLGSSLKGLRDNYHRLDAEVTRFNHAINQRTVSNLTMIELRLERNARVMDAIEELVKADELKLFADERRASDAARLLHDWVASDSRKLNLTHLFELCFVAFSHDGKQIVYRNLDRIESHGTTVTIKALVNMHLMGQLIEESRLGEVRIPYYLDEAASIDPRNQEILIEQGLAMGFVPVLASVKPQATATYCVRVANESGLGRLVITENDWVQLEKKPRPGGTPVA
ncbi:MAG: hypothetical protein BWZ02_02382 [Lentisphaerae bacterium ADurb.BinA184]|nr:MAG: hypothetical protein BWZ02_02382 [Lentisphaerae bacterium ADurb.BinA184]